MFYSCYAACSFGLEACVADELKKIGARNVHSQDARVNFSADETLIARINIWSSAADRIYLILKEFDAYTFDELFEGVASIHFGEFLPKNANMHVLGDAVHSELKSVSDVQSIAKKAIIRAMSNEYGISFFREDGNTYQIYVHILKNHVTVSLNTSGAGLNRRGYRVKTTDAPIRETLAAGLILNTRWYDRPFYDIMCGSGTIAIEAAMKAANIAPGMNRPFDAENWEGLLFGRAFSDEKSIAATKVDKTKDIPIFAYDINPKALDVARYHAKIACVDDMITFKKADATLFVPETPVGTIIANPPYAVRLGDATAVHDLYRKVGHRLRELNGYKYYFISGDEDFEKHFGKKADKKRKVYNGNMKCCFYQYFRNK